MPRELAQIYNYLNRGDLRQAETLCRAALRENPFDAAVIDILGVAARGQGDNLKAVEHFKNAISLEPKMGLYRCHLALALRALGRRGEALEAFEDAIANDPSSFEAVYNFSQFLNETGEAARAIEMASQAVALDPKFAPARNNLGVFLQSSGRLEEAATEYRQAIRFDPNHVNAHANLANTLSESDRIEDALALLDRALKKWPRNVDLLNARANAFLRRNDPGRAIATADSVIEIDPSYAQAHYAKGLALLIQDRFTEGFAEYEWRVKRAGFAPRRSYAQPRWGGEPMAGKTLLVHWEQGFGDIIQFCRYLPLLRALFDASPLHAGARIVFDCPRKLIELVKTAGGCEDIGDYGDAPPPFDAYIPLMSLAPLLGITAQTIPSHASYLSPGAAEDVDLTDAPPGAPKVGITWASDHGESYRRKVMSIRDLAPVFRSKACQFYGLQYGAEAKDLEPFVGGNVGNLGARLGDFSHTAGIISKLDLVIAIDTYVVHLAGAIGTPAWVMLPFSPDWRWGLGRSDTPWYPKMRLFRQPKPGDWKSVVAEVARALDTFAQP